MPSIADLESDNNYLYIVLYTLLFKLYDEFDGIFTLGNYVSKSLHSWLATELTNMYHK